VRIGALLRCSATWIGCALSGHPKRTPHRSGQVDCRFLARLHWHIAIHMRDRVTRPACSITTEMRACQSVTPRVRYRCADRTPIADSVLEPRGDMRRKRVVMRVAGVSHADRAQSWPGVGRAVRVCNRPSVRGRCAPGQRRDRLNGDAKRGWRRLAAGRRASGVVPRVISRPPVRARTP